MKACIAKLKAIAEETRFRIVRVLLEFDWLYVCEIVDGLGISFYNVSRHLKELRILGIVKEEREGRFVRYSIKKPESDFDLKMFEMIKCIELKEDITRVMNILSEPRRRNCKLP